MVLHACIRCQLMPLSSSRKYQQPVLCVVSMGSLNQVMQLCSLVCFKIFLVLALVCSVLIDRVLLSLEIASTQAQAKMQILRDF